MDNINWYPGHMKKTRETIKKNLKLVDAVIEIIDARIPVSSRNPIIDELAENKQRIIVLNKSDLSDKKANLLWIDALKNENASSNINGSAHNTRGIENPNTADRTYNELTKKKNVEVIATNSMSGEGIKKLMQKLEMLRKLKNKGQQRNHPYRIMIAGIPNVGKSSLINRLSGRKSTKVGNKPGITKGKQWITLKNGIQLLDTPGILWPKFENLKTGLNLAFCGSIKDEILDLQTLGLDFAATLRKYYPEEMKKRYKLNAIADSPLEDIKNIARKRGFISAVGQIDYERTARTLLDDFRSGKIGNLTLEWPDNPETASYNNI